MQRGWRIGRIGGVEIRVDPSLAIVAALIAFNLWASFSDRSQYPETSSLVAGGVALLTTLLFFGSILAHELAHAGMSKVRRIPVVGITLYMFGGATQASIESRGPADEFLVTVVGPGTSLALGALFLLAWSGVRDGGGHPIVSMFLDLGRANLLLGVFNLLPGFPLDGGRLLRSVVWRVTGSLARATRVAARSGQGMAAVIIGVGVFFFVRDQNPLALWPALIGWFLFRAASSALAEGDRRRRLESATARQVMSPPPPTVPAELPVEEALHRYLTGHEGEAFPVVDSDRVVGFVSLGTIRGVPLDRPVREAMVGTRGTVEAGPSERLDLVADRLGTAESRTVLVVEDGTLVGVIEPEDVARFLRGAGGGSGDRGASDPPLPPRPDAG
jgi:Zn-dependent protease/predicted transcriptional regulator